MSFGKVDAGNGVGWLTDSVRLILNNPVAFLVMGLILGVINFVPILGSLVITISGPAFFGGIAYAAREESEGRKAEISHLFRAFQEPGKIGPMLMLCLPAIVGGAILLVLALVFGVGALISGGLSAANDSAFGWGALGGGVLILCVLALAIGFVIYALQFFAVPRVMLDGVEPFAAMKESLSACMANIGAFLLFGIVLIVAFIVLGIVLGLIPLLGWIALGAGGFAVVGCAQYIAWRQVFGGAVASVPPAPPEVLPPQV
ncbi:MAG: BPSS1780 family membrane protein [Rhodanobacteraceae bacterium]